MICKQCTNEAHLICGLNLNCSCCQKTLREIWQEDEQAFKLLLKKLKEKQNVKTKIKQYGGKSREEKN